MPCQFLLSSTLTGDGLHTGGTSLGKQLSKALGAIWFVVAAGEPLPGQRGLAVTAGEAVTVPRFVLVGHTAAGDNLGALDAACRVLLLVAAGAVDVVLARNKGLGADRRFADAAAEALLVPLSRFVFHLLGACNDDMEGVAEEINKQFATLISAVGY